MNWFRSRRKIKPAGQIVKDDDRELGIVDLGSAVSHDVRALINRNTLTHGEPFRSGGVLSTSCLPVLGAGSTVTSSLLAGNVFLATANPATLMAIEGGVGSAVVGAGGTIVAQAPFIAASTAILPVVSPIMFFMTVSSMMTSFQFDRLQSSLDRLAEMISELMRREISGDYGEVLSAIDRLKDISSEFNESRLFTDDMKIRLALVERDLSVMKYKYDILSSKLPNETTVNMAPIDQHLYALSSVASVFVDGQRLRLALQDNPDDLKRSVKDLDGKIRDTRERFTNILNNNPIVDYQKGLRQSIEEMTWWERKVSQKGGKRRLEEANKNAAEIRVDQLAPVLDSVQSWSDQLADIDENSFIPSIVYYRSDNGKGELKAYYTSDISLQTRQNS